MLYIYIYCSCRTDEELELIFNNEHDANWRVDHFAFGWQKKKIKSVALDHIRTMLPESIQYWADIAYCLLFWQKGLLLDIDHLKEVRFYCVLLY